MITLKDLKIKVQKRISDYLGFDVNEIFDQSDYITIYGGAVRDSIAGLEIHDIDILCMPDSAIKLNNFLKEQKGYDKLDLYDRESISMYKEISLISEPWTLMNSDRKIVQIIRPCWHTSKKMLENQQSFNETDSIDYEMAYMDLIKNVDLSCCGVFLEKSNGELKLREACKNAIIHCLSRVYESQEWSKLYNMSRSFERENKLNLRGWMELNDYGYYYLTDEQQIEKKRKERRMKIYTLEFKPEEEYKIWTEEEYISRIKNKSGKPKKA
jgi:hypothetical protein